MKTLWLTLILCFIAIPAFADCTSSVVGHITYTNCDDGKSFTGTNIGGLTYYNGDVNGTAQNMGSMTFYNLDHGVSGTSHTIGNTDFHNFSNGVSGSTTHIGNTSFTNLSGGLEPAPATDTPKTKPASLGHLLGLVDDEDADAESEKTMSNLDE